MSDIPLGKASRYPVRYAPEVLHPVARRDARAKLRLPTPLPFTGEDVWNAWELTWLDANGKPLVGTATLRVGAESANIIESKSLKLYLNSFSQSSFASPDELRDVMRRDLSELTGGPIDVTLSTAADAFRHPVAFAVSTLPGTLIDNLDASCSADGVDAALLSTVGEDVVNEELHTHLLRSLCPVTNQPDMGSLLVRYRGRRIDPVGLLQYVVSFRRHSDFHEACVERMFVDLKTRCGCERLTVYARYNRRGGIDINPFRSDFETGTDNPRLWRQ